MKTIYCLLCCLLLGWFIPSVYTQSWFTRIPARENGRINYPAAKAYVEQYRQTHPDGTLKGEKQFLRSRFFLEGRIDGDGYLPSGIYWEEAKRVISERALYRSEQTPWQYIGPDNSTIGITSGEVGGSGRIDCITFHPDDPDIFYVGAPSGGLWKTTDGGVSWQVLTDALPTLGISDIDLHPQNPEILFICTGTRDVWWETFSVGILKSEDGGDNWVKIVAGNFMDLAQKEGDPTVLFATNFNYYSCGAKIYRSTDAGLYHLKISGNGTDLGKKVVISR